MVRGDHDHRHGHDRIERGEHLAHVRFTRGTSAHAHHSAQQQCTLGMAAYWFEMFFIAPELNVQSVGYLASVSTKP